MGPPVIGERERDERDRRTRMNAAERRADGRKGRSSAAEGDAVTVGPAARPCGPFSSGPFFHACL